MHTLNSTPGTVTVYFSFFTIVVETSYRAKKKYLYIAIDILYLDDLTKMRISTGQLTTNSYPMYGFTGDNILTEGMV